MEEHPGQDIQKEELQIPDDLESIFSDPEIPEGKRKLIKKAIIGITVSKATSFIGPVPPPEILKGYNDIINNGAERIFVMAEKQSIHRMQLEDHAIKEELRQSRTGQIFGFTIGIIGMGLAAALAILGHETIAGIFATTTIGGLVTVFVIGRKSQQKDLAEKDKQPE